jgi:hypothetical protein
VRLTQEPFPALVHLSLQFDPNNGHAIPLLPDGFLGGSFPRLQFLVLHSCIPSHSRASKYSSPRSPTLERIPHNGYISESPEAIVACLAVLANLKFFIIEFKSRRPSLLTHSVLYLLLLTFRSEESVNTWRTSWPSSMPPCRAPPV